MRTRIAFTLFVLFLTATAAFAGDVRGKVTYPDGTPYVKASVTIKSGSGQSATVYTGTDGMFLHPGIPAGEYTLEVKTPKDARSVPVRVTPDAYVDVPPVRVN
jgi:hypothetical protein